MKALYRHSFVLRRVVCTNGWLPCNPYHISPAYGLRHFSPQPGISTPGQDDAEDAQTSAPKPQPPHWRSTVFKMFESAATTFASLLILGVAGYGYHKYYKSLVLKKMENAFKPGDPALEIAALEKDDRDIPTDAKLPWVREAEQAKLDAIVRGEDYGHYYLIIGEKGTGKSSMLLHAMSKIDGEGISMFEAHAELEIFRIRLGRALDYEFHEDYIGSLFSIRGPREGTTALLDIERAFNKLEKIALKRRRRVGRPLVLIINSTHLLRDDENGRDLLELVQQRAEQWAASKLITVVLNSDDYWVYERLKQYATRMEVVPILDLTKPQALTALREYRQRFHHETPPDSVLEAAYQRVGGRLTFLARVAKAKDIMQTCHEICQMEKIWFLNKCWILGESMDDDVMDQQKYASAAMVLAKALVDMENDTTSSRTDGTAPPSYDTQLGHALPQIPLHEAREIMTRADFIKDYDHYNIFAMTADAMVHADSVPMMIAFREICSQPGFEAHLQGTLDRISAIESLGRTRELVAKDLVAGGKYDVKPDDRGLRVSLQPPKERDE